MATVELSTIDLLVLKKLTLINHALAMQLSDRGAAKEQLALTRALSDIIRRAEATPEQREG